MNKPAVENLESTKEDYVFGCFTENYKKPHICPIATGGWCKSYTRCKEWDKVKSSCITTEEDG